MDDSLPQPNSAAVHAMRTRASRLAQRGLLASALELLEQALKQAEGPLDTGRVHNTLTKVLLDAGQLNEALSHQRQAEAGFLAAGSPKRVMAYGNKAAILCRLGREEAALVMLDKAEAALPKENAAPIHAAILANRVNALHTLGRELEAEPYVAQALALVEACPPQLQSRTLSTVGAAIAARDPALGAHCAERALKLARDNDDPACEAQALYAMALVPAPPKAQRRLLIQALQCCGEDHILRTDLVFELSKTSACSGPVGAHLDQALEADLALRQVLQSSQRSGALGQRVIQTLCHDLRNPLTAMMMASHAVETEEPGDVQELVLLVQDQCQYMAELLAQLEDTAAALDGRVTVKRAASTARTVLAGAQKRARGAAGQKDIALVLQGDEAATCLADARLLDRVLDNLVSNALKFSATGTRVRLGVTSDEEESVTLWVHDQGPGLSQEDLDTIFEPFGKGSARPTAGERSTGMGLFLARELVQFMGGTLQARDAEGARFEIRLPRAGPH